MRDLLRSVLSDSFLDAVLFGGRVEDWLVTACVVVVTAVLARLGRGALVWLAGRLRHLGTSKARRIAVGVVRDTTATFLFALALFGGARFAGWRGDALEVVQVFLGVATLVQLGRWSTGVVREVIDGYEDEEARGWRVMRVQVLGAMVWIGVWVLVALLVVANLGVDVTTLLAGVGIGGIAISFALKSVLEDLFASFSIVLDRPFVVGDLLTVGRGAEKFEGDVQHVGLKSTRLRSLTGEQVIVANADLLASRLRNYENMRHQRRDLVVRVSYATPRATLREIPAIIESIVAGLSGRGGLPALRHDRTNLREFAASTLDFETKYYVESKSRGPTRRTGPSCSTSWTRSTRVASRCRSRRRRSCSTRPRPTGPPARRPRPPRPTPPRPEPAVVARRVLPRGGAAHAPAPSGPAPPAVRVAGTLLGDPLTGRARADACPAPPAGTGAACRGARPR